MTLCQRFIECTQGPWTTGGDDIQYRIVRNGPAASVFFMYTDENSVRDIINDIDFPAVPYKDQPIPWRAHRGFVRGFKSVIDEIAAQLEGVEKIYIAGHSAGGAYATLMHEWAWMNIAPDVETFTFGAPRVLWMPGREIKARFENLTRCYVNGDIVTMVPPAALGYQHAGKPVRVGAWKIPSWQNHIGPAYPAAMPN